MIVLPGLDGTGHLHGAFLAALGDGFASARVIAYPKDRFLDHAALEAFVRAALPRQAPFVLLGESFSGPIAIAIAARAPPNLVGLVLSTTFARFPTRAFALLAPLMALAPVHHAPDAVLRWWLLGADATRAQVDALKHTLRQVSADVLRRRSRAALEVDASACVHDIKVPVLDLRGTHDRLVPRRAGESLRGALTDCALVEIRGPHLLLQASPTECAAAVRAFVGPLGGV